MDLVYAVAAEFAASKRGADVRPDFNWNKPQSAMMSYR